MKTIVAQGVSIDYIVEGEGFPLVLMPEPRGTLGLWAPYIPLLGEMCRILAYAPTGFSPRVLEIRDTGQSQDLSLLDMMCVALRLERVYLASPLCSWHVALQCGLTTPERVEALLLVGLRSASGHPCATPSALPDSTQLAQMQVPTLVLTGDAPASAHRVGETLAQTLPRCTHLVLPSTEFLPTNNSALPPGHAMMRFLMHCERQRTLVRGASFLL